MTSKQTSLYWRTWNRVRIELIHKGEATTETAEQNRHELHVKALGYDKSSKALTNAEFDKILSVFRAITEPGNLNAQLRQIDQPYRRFYHHATGLIRAVGEVPENAIDSYLKGTCQRLTKKAPEELTAQERNTVIAALAIHRRRKLKKIA